MNAVRWLAFCATAALTACGGGDDPAPARTSDLALSATVAPGPAPAGGTSSITLTLANSGPAPAVGVQLAATWGEGLAAGDATCEASGGATCPPRGAVGDLPDIPAGGQLGFTLPVRVAAGAHGAISSTFVASASNEARPADNAASPVVDVYQADVSVTGVAAASEVLAGGTVTYTMTVANKGPDDARDVAIVDTLGPAQVLQSISCIAAAGATCPAAPGASMSVPLLPRNGSLAFTVVAQVAAGTSGNIANAMRATAAGDPAAGNDAAEVQATAFDGAIPGQSSVTLHSEPGDPVGLGRSYFYTRANAVITAGGALSPVVFSIQVRGAESWDGTYLAPITATRFEPGTHPTVGFIHDSTAHAFAWHGEGRSCANQSGTITINSVTFSPGGSLSGMDFSFEQRCVGATGVLRGCVHWVP